MDHQFITVNVVLTMTPEDRLLVRAIADRFDMTLDRLASAIITEATKQFYKELLEDSEGE